MFYVVIAWLDVTIFQDRQAEQNFDKVTLSAQFNQNITIIYFYDIILQFNSQSVLDAVKKISFISKNSLLEHEDDFEENVLEEES